MLALSLILLAPLSGAFGYGTSSISFSQQSITVAPGSTTNVSYTVNLASGNAWGTNLNLINAAQLAGAGVSVTISNPSGNPPYSGYLIVHAPSNQGSWTLMFNATGDDPSVVNANLTLISQTPTTTTKTETTAPTTTATTTSGYNSIMQKSSYLTLGALTTLLIVIIIATLIVAAYFILRLKSMAPKMIVIGVVLIIIGTAVWLYGDYGAGPQYMWPGVIGILLGTLIWLYGDAVSGVFVMKK